MAKNCLYNKGKMTAKDKDGDGVNLAHEESYDYETMVFMATVLDDHTDLKTWFLDKNCSNHMTGHKAWLTNFD